MTVRNRALRAPGQPPVAPLPIVLPNGQRAGIARERQVSARVPVTRRRALEQVGSVPVVAMDCSARVAVMAYNAPEAQRRVPAMAPEYSVRPAEKPRSALQVGLSSDRPTRLSRAPRVERNSARLAK